MLFSTMSLVPWIPNSFPQTRRSNHVDIYKSAARGQVRVPDPYNWLEEYSEETDRWTHLQGSFTRSYLDKIPDRQHLEKLFLKVNDYAKVFFSTNCPE
jgi:prolyl oligopeptidase